MRKAEVNSTLTISDSHYSYSELPPFPGPSKVASITVMPNTTLQQLKNAALTTYSGKSYESDALSYHYITL